MERNYFTSIGLVVGCVLFLQAGCEKEAVSPEKPQTALVTPEPTRQGKSPAGVSTVAPEKAEITSESGEPASKITFENLIYDFGEVEPAKQIIGEFKFTNTGNGPLKITKIGKCCGAVPRLDKDTQEYAPGESGILTVEYHSSWGPGTMTRQLHVHSNDKEKPEVTLTIKAKIVVVVQCEPKNIGLALNSENAGCPDITITSLNNRPFSIKAFKSPGDCITADINSVVQATKFILSPKVDIEKLKKNLNGRIEINLTHPNTHRVIITYSTLPKFKLNPLVFIVFDAEPQKLVKRDVWILNNYGGDFEIESISSKNDNIKVLSHEKISNGYHFEVEITPPVKEGEQKIFTDALTINIKDNEPMEIACRGFYHGSGQSP